jgi:hypothetical protein
MKFNRYILPSALILVLGLGLAVAQNITKALQLSQDATGAFGVDANNGVYFPGHVLSPTARNSIPTITGTGTPTVAGTDTSGTITMGSSATTATAVFGRAYLSVPSCVVSSQTSFTTTPIGYTLATTSIAITQQSTSGNKINYWCSSNS